MQDDILRRRYQELVARGNGQVDKQREIVDEIRKVILQYGIPPETELEITQLVDAHKCTLRGKLWKILLAVGIESANPYFELVASGKSIFHDKISNDVPRTFQGDRNAQIRVCSDKLTRILNAFAKGHKNASIANMNLPNAYTSKKTMLQFGYVQGMNVLAGALLMVMPELDAFHAFNALIMNNIPMYIQPSLQGVDLGIKLLDECFEVIDKELFDRLSSTIKLTNLSRIYAFERVLTLNMSTQPLQEAIKLWDFLLAFGVHMNVLCLIAQVVSIRDELLHPSMKSITNRLGHREFPPLQATPIIAKAIRYVKMLPADLYDRLVKHSTF